MVTLNIKEAYYDHPNFLDQVDLAQKDILTDWEEILEWVKAYRNMIDSLKVFQKKTYTMTNKFETLRRGIYKENLDLESIEKMKNAVDIIFNTHISLLTVLDQEVIVPVINVKTKIQEDLELKKQKYFQQRNEYFLKAQNFIGLKKCWMEPSLAIQLVEESHQLYNLKLQKCQTYLNWIDYINQLKCHSELWWYNKLNKFFSRFTRWHSECLTGLRSTEEDRLQLEENLHQFPEVINLDIAPTQNKMAFELFSQELGSYRKELGLPELDELKFNLSDLNTNTLLTEVQAGPLLYQLKGSEHLNFNLAFFEMDHAGWLSIWNLMGEELPKVLKEPLPLFNYSIKEINHPNRHNVFILQSNSKDNIIIYLQAETTSLKKGWLNGFQRFCTEIQFEDNNNNNNNNNNNINDNQFNQKENEYNENQSEKSSYKERENQSLHSRATSEMGLSKLSNDPIDYLNENNKKELSFNELEEVTIKIAKAFIREYKSNKNKDLLTYHPSTIGSWRPILLHLSSLGILKFYSELDKTLLNQINLKEIHRFHIQRVDDSYFHEKSIFSIEVNEDEIHHFKVNNPMERNIWLCLIKSFAQPEILGKLLPIPKLYRIYRSFWLRILDGKNLRSNEALYCQIFADDKMLAFTNIKGKSFNPFWREDFHLDDLSSFKEGITINLMIHHKYSKDLRLAHCFIPVKSIRSGEFYEGWYPLMDGDSQPILKLKLKKEEKPVKKRGGIGLNSILTLNSHDSLNNNNQNNNLNNNNQLKNLPISFNYLGDLRLKLRYDEVIILKSNEYFKLLELVMDYESDLIYDLILNNTHLDWLSEIYLKIYSAKSQPTQLLNYLAWKEVELTDDANILFRGNSVLTKAIDAYMKMIGLQYLEDTIGDIIREVCNNKIICEVDSNKLEKPEEVKGQWKILFSYCERLWCNIQLSKHLCPRELRWFFYNLRNLISEKYKDQTELLLMTRYTCVSGFLFLRLFCPAVLSPKLFGIVKEHPDPKTHRTLTLLAKSLQCLANLADFGVKEPYMAQMNGFIMDNMNNLMDFIDYIASPPSEDILPVQQSYRLPPHPSGFLGPSPPFVIDVDRELSSLCGFVTRYASELKQKVNNLEERLSKPGKLERLLSVCHAIDFMTRDCLKAGNQVVAWRLVG